MKVAPQMIINADNAPIEAKVRPQFISNAGIATDCHRLPQPFAKINTKVLKFCFWQFASCGGCWWADPRPILNLASHQSMAHICNFSSKAIQTLIKILLLNFSDKEGNYLFHVGNIHFCHLSMATESLIQSNLLFVVFSLLEKKVPFLKTRVPMVQGLWQRISTECRACGYVWMLLDRSPIGSM